MAFCIACSFPNSDRVSHRWRDAEIDDEAYKPLRTLLAAQNARSADEPLVVTFTSRARDLWREISDDLYAEAEARDFPAVLIGPWAKLEAYVIHLALVLHLMRCAFDASIDATQCDHVSLGAAADLVDYFKTHAQQVYARLIARPQDVRLLHVVSWTKEHGGHCTPSEVVRAGVSGIKTTAEAEAILAEIAANCWGRYETIPNPRGKDTMRLMLYDPNTRHEGGRREMMRTRAPDSNRTTCPTPCPPWLAVAHSVGVTVGWITGDISLDGKGHGGQLRA